MPRDTQVKLLCGLAAPDRSPTLLRSDCPAGSIAYGVWTGSTIFIHRRVALRAMKNCYELRRRKLIALGYGMTLLILR